MAIFRIPRVRAELADISRSTFYAQVNLGLLPTPIKLGARAAGLPDFEVAAIAQARIAGKSDDDIKALVQRMHAARAQVGEL